MVKLLWLVLEICMNELFQYMRVDAGQAGRDRAALRAIERGEKLANNPLCAKIRLRCFASKSRFRIASCPIWQNLIAPS